MQSLSRPWCARVLRLTLFLPAPLELVNDNTWAGVVGERPALDNRLPRDEQRIQGGPVGPGFLLIHAQPGRLDWLMTPAPPSDGAVPSNEFGPVPDALQAFQAIVRKWLATLAQTPTRMAVGLIAIIPTPDRLTAYGVLDELLQSVEVDAEHTRDLNYAINRPKPGRVRPAVELNRITRWGAQMFSVFDATTGTPRPIGDGVYVSVECDNSTPAEPQELELGSLVDLYDELMEMALQNLEHGEIA